MRYAIGATGFFAGYILAASFCERWAGFDALGIRLIWLPAGVAVAAFMAFEWWALFLVWLAALCNAWPLTEAGGLEAPLTHVLIDTVGETAQAAFIWRLWRSDLPHGLTTSGDVLRLIILACFVPVVVGALEAALKLLAGDEMIWRRLPLVTMTGGFADCLGILTVVPAYAAWRETRAVARYELGWISLYFVPILVLLYYAQHGYAAAVFLAIPILFSLAMQLGLRGELLGQGLLFLGLVAATAQGQGPFIHPDPLRTYVDFLSFMLSLGLAAMGIAATQSRLLSENLELRSNLQDHNAMLEKTVAEREWLHQQVMHRAHCDELTGLPNRAMFFDRLEQSIIQARRRGTRFALFFIDLDGFKLINDTWGHEAGDFLLRQVGERLRGCVREYDTIARMGGDEFTVIVNDISFRRSAAIVADKVIASLAKPFLLPEGPSQVGASIGIAIYPDDGEEAELLLNRADSAMYEVKRQGKNQRRFFSEDAEADGSAAL